MSKITVCLTSCNRFDLLEKTLDSFISHNNFPIDKILITEDSTKQDMKEKILAKYGNKIELIFNPVNLGIYKSIDNMYSRVKTDYIFHCEDDWYFNNNNPNFLRESLDILESRPDIHRVCVRKDLDANFIETNEQQTFNGTKFNLLKNPHCGDWCGFSNNPGLRRKADYETMFPNGYYPFTIEDKAAVHTEHACNLHAQKLGYRAALLSNRISHHLGYGRTTLTEPKPKKIMQITKKNITFKVDSMTGDNDGWGFWNHVVSNVWEPHTFEILKRFLSKDKSYIDIGAWVGPTVLFGSQLSKKCYAFEPDPHAFEALETNLNLNPQITNVEAFQKAIADRSGSIRMGSNSKRGDSMSSLLFSGADTWQVDATTLQEFIDSKNITDCNFIKMDIEGGEYIVLPYIKEVLKSIRPTVYLALHTAWINDKESFYRTVEDCLSHYKNLYSNDGKKISWLQIRDLPLFTEIVVTDEEW